MAKRFADGVTLLGTENEQRANPMYWIDKESGTQLERSGGSPEVYRFVNSAASIVGAWRDTMGEAIDDGPKLTPISRPLPLGDDAVKSWVTVVYQTVGGKTVQKSVKDADSHRCEEDLRSDPNVIEASVIVT